MILGFGVWVHHMFATGLPGLALSFFSGASIIITVPSAVAVFAWIATIWLGRPVITTAFLFFASMIVLFVIGGVSGFMTASVPVDWQLTDTYFVVAHLHYVLIGINVFPVVGGALLLVSEDDRPDAGRAARQLELLDDVHRLQPCLPADAPDRPAAACRGASTPIPRGMGWDDLNLITTIGAFVFAIGVLLVLVNIVASLRRGAVAGPNPWDAPTLEWSVPSPPPPYNFAVIPHVASRHPLWEGRLQETAAHSSLDAGMVLDHGRETVGTSPLDGEPDVILQMPEDFVAPFLLALAASAFFVGLLLHLWWLALAGVVVVALAVLIWLWPERRLRQRVETQHV